MSCWVKVSLRVLIIGDFSQILKVTFVKSSGLRTFSIR